jgi:DNA-binding MarR family transcriptional regulator
MRSEDEQQNPLDSPMYRDLRLISEVDETPEVNQRQLSLRLGISLGLTNVLLKNLVQKGYVRVSNASWKRRLYNLTPDGLAHKLRLTTGYISRVLDHYQNVRQTLREQMDGLDVNEESRIAVCSANEFAELVYLGLKEFGIGEIAFYSKGKEVGQQFLGMPVGDVMTIKFEDFDKVVIAELYETKELNQILLNLGVPEQKIVTFFTSEPSKNGRPVQ